MEPPVFKAKRKADFTDPERPGIYHFPLPQQSHTPQSSEASTSPHSSPEGQMPKGLRKLASLTVQNGISFDVVGTRIDASFHASSSKTRLLSPPPTSSGTPTLPPIALSCPLAFISKCYFKLSVRPSSLQQHQVLPPAS